MKVFNWFFIVTFIIFAGLQYNDPDPYVWMPIYLYAAVLCWLSIKKKYYPLMYWIGYAAYTPYALYKVFDQYGVIDWITKYRFANIASTMKAETPWVEETREFFGLVIVISVLAINQIYLARQKKAADKVPFSSFYANKPEQ